MSVQFQNLATHRGLALLAWVVVTSLYAFLAFGWDKALAQQAGRRRISERHLLVASAAGGWLGGLLGMLAFRHKTAKISFMAKFAVAFAIWLGLLFLCWRAQGTPHPFS